MPCSSAPWWELVLHSSKHRLSKCATWALSHCLEQKILVANLNGKGFAARIIRKVRETRNNFNCYISRCHETAICSRNRMLFKIPYVPSERICSLVALIFGWHYPCLWVITNKSQLCTPLHFKACAYTWFPAWEIAYFWIYVFWPLTVVITIHFERKAKIDVIFLGFHQHHWLLLLGGLIPRFTVFLVITCCGFMNVSPGLPSHFLLYCPPGDVIQPCSWLWLVSTPM